MIDFLSKKRILFFIALIFIISALQFSLISSQLEFGLSPDDISFLSEFKLLGDNPFSKVNYTWDHFGPHFTSAIYYIGSLETLFGFNFKSYYMVAHIFKIFSAVTLFFLILAISKNTILATLSSLLYTIHYSPVGSLEMVVRSNDFIALSLLNIFLICYYKIFKDKRNSFKYLFPVCLLLVFGFSANIIRMFPILLFILLIEAYFLIFNRVYFSFKRVFIIFSPYILISLFDLTLVKSIVLQTRPVIDKIIIGNWQLALKPLASFGSMFFLENHWRIFGEPPVNNLEAYLIYLSGFAIIFTLPTLLISFTVFKNPKKFLIQTILLNIFANTLIFAILSRGKIINTSEFDTGLLLPLIVFGSFILSLIYSFWRQWNNDKSDMLLLLLWLSPIFSLIFILLTFFFYQDFIGIKGYLTIPSMGVAVFIAALLYKMVKKFEHRLKFIPLFTFLIIPLLYPLSKVLIKQYLDYHLTNGMRASDQEAVRNNLIKYLTNFSYKEPSLFYLDRREDYKNNTFYGLILLNEFSHWFQTYDSKMKDRCIMPRMILDDDKKLTRIATIKEGKPGFVYQSFCDEKKFYNTQDFYAFKLKDKTFINIKDELIEKIIFTNATSFF